MAVNCSTGFRTLILGPTSFEAMFNGGCIEVRTGSQPASADLPPTGALIGRITHGDGPWSPGAASGLRFVRDGIAAMNSPAQDWRLRGEGASGTAGWFRLLPGRLDSGEMSTTVPRIDGAIGPLEATGDYQLRLPLLDLTPSTETSIPSWWFLLPPIS